MPFIVRGVPVSFKDIRSDLTISNEETTREVTLRVQGPRDVVERLRPESFSIVVPLGGKSPGDRVVRLRDDAAIEKPANIEILEIRSNGKLTFSQAFGASRRRISTWSTIA